jgi:hypothetical protein
MMACRVFEEVAIQDGAVGWYAMIGACNGYFGGLLPAAGASEVSAGRDVVLAGTFRPAGVAVAVEGGYRVAERWPIPGAPYVSRTASQHLQVMPTNYEVAGQLFLGADMSATTWSRDSRATDRERRRDT